MSKRDSDLAAIAARHHGCFNFDHLSLLGFTEFERDHRIRSGRWLVVHDGCYRLAGVPASWRGDVQAACWAGGTRAVVSHRSAANLHGMPGRSDQFVEITCPRARRTQHDGMVVHESRALEGCDIAFVERIPVTTVERTIFDLASVCSRTTVDLAIDNVLRRGLTTFDDLAAMLRRVGKRGRKGTKTIRDLLETRDSQYTPTASEQELLVLHAIRRHGFPEPVRQYEIRDRYGQFLGRADLAYPSLQIAVEYDSYQEHSGNRALVRDSRRRNALQGAGWAVLVATAEDVRYGQGHALATELRNLTALARQRGS
jgi:hypothetical protein